MKRQTCFLPALILCILAWPGSAFGEDAEPMTVMWEDLLPEGEIERLEELYEQMEYSPFSHMGFDQMTQIGTFNVVEGLNGKRVRVPGYVLPLNLERGLVREFLLVPYFGACIHVPPPPPNQIVYVRAEEPVRVEDLWDPVWVEGVLSTEKHMNDLGDAAYTLALASMEPYVFTR